MTLNYLKPKRIKPRSIDEWIKGEYTEPLIYDRDEAKDFDMDLGEFWRLVVKPSMAGQAPRFSLLSPEGEEIGDDESYDFTGRPFTPSPQPQQQALEPDGIEDLSIATEALRQSTEGLPDYTGPELPGVPRSQDLRNDPEWVIKKVINPEWDIDMFNQAMRDDPDWLVNTMMSKGRNPYTESLLRLLGADDEFINQIFPGPEPIPKSKYTITTPEARDKNTPEYLYNQKVMEIQSRYPIIPYGGKMWRSAEGQKLQEDMKKELKLAWDEYQAKLPGFKESLVGKAFLKAPVSGKGFTGDIGKMPTATWLDRVEELMDTPGELIPFLGSTMEIATIGTLLKTAKDLEDGKEVSKEDLLMLKDYVNQAQRDKSWGYKVLDVLVNLVPFAGEILLTGGLYSLGKEAGMKAATTALQKLTTKAGAEILEKALVKYGIKAAGIVAGGTLGSLPGAIAKMPAGTLEKQLQHTLTGDEEAVWESAVKSFGEQWVEYVSERTGGMFSPLTSAVKGQLMKVGILKTFLKANPSKGVDDVKRLLDKMGYNGVIEEMLEERVADVGHGILYALGLGDQQFSFPSLQQLSVELASFSVPGVAVKSMEALAGNEKKIREFLAGEGGYLSIPGVTETFKVPQTAEAVAGAEARLGAPAKILKELATPKETAQYNTLKAEALKAGFDLEAVEGIGKGEYWVSITRTTKEEASDLRWEWLKNLEKKGFTKEQDQILGGVASTTITGGKPFYAFKNIADAEQFLKTGDTSLIVTELKLKGEPMPHEQISRAREASAEREKQIQANQPRIKELEKQIDQLVSSLDKARKLASKENRLSEFLKSTEYQSIQENIDFLRAEQRDLKIGLKAEPYGTYGIPEPKKFRPKPGISEETSEARMAELTLLTDTAKKVIPLDEKLEANDQKMDKLFTQKDTMTEDAFNEAHKKLLDEYTAIREQIAALNIPPDLLKKVRANPEYADMEISKVEPPVAKSELTPEVTPQAKQPWQMTRAEYLKEPLTQRQWSPNKKDFVEGNLHYEDAKQSHKMDVQKALADGKPVPAEVLKDYPDLAKQVQEEARASYRERVSKDIASQKQTVNEPSELVQINAMTDEEYAVYKAKQQPVTPAVKKQVTPPVAEGKLAPKPEYSIDDVIALKKIQISKETNPLEKTFLGQELKDLLAGKKAGRTTVPEGYFTYRGKTEIPEGLKPIQPVAEGKGQPAEGVKPVGQPQAEAEKGLPNAEINQIVADLNLLREERVWIDTMQTKGSSIIGKTGRKGTIVEPAIDFSSSKLQERQVQVKWEDGSEWVVDSWELEPAKLQKEIAEITHGKPITDFPIETPAPEKTMTAEEAQPEYDTTAWTKAWESTLNKPKRTPRVVNQAENVPPPPPPDSTVPPGTLPPPEPFIPPIVPSPIAENVIGLRTIQPGLVRSETIGNFFKDLIGKMGIQTVEADPMANAAMRERARVRTAIESNANVLGTEGVDILKVFTFDKQGRIPDLAGVDTTITGAPTIQDVAARLPLFRDSLTDAQKTALSELKNKVEPYHSLLTEVGVEVASRSDIMDGGFYLPRGRAALEGADEPIKVGGGRRGTKKGFEKPATFNSMADGINAGFEYSQIGQSLTAYAFDAGTRATDAHVVNYFKALTDDTGNLIGETVKMRLIRQNPELAAKIEAVNATLTKLKRNIGALTQRQLDVIDLWQHDPEYSDIDTLLDGLATMKGGQPAVTLPELRTLYENARNDLQALKPEYKLALRKAQTTPRDQGIINLPSLQGWTFPDEITNAANQILSKEGRLTGHLSDAINIVNAFNNLYRGIRATLDDSALGIQGLLGFYGKPESFAKAFVVNIKAWGIGGDKVLGKFMTEFDAKAVKEGKLTSSEWSRAGLHLGGATSEFNLGQGLGDKIGGTISNLPAVRQANRVFGYFGDVLRLQWADGELATQMAKRTLNQIKESGDSGKIANGANVMTGWTTGKAAGSFGDILLFAPKFLQARLETVAKAGMGMRPGATLDQRMARNSMLRLIGIGVVLTIAGNMLAGEDDTDFRPIVDGKRNGKFMRIKYKGNYYSLFGTWDSLLGVFINIGTGKPLQALRNLGSGLTAGAFDLITGRDYNYKAVRDTPMHFLQWLGNSIVPFSAGQIPQGVKKFAGGLIDGKVDETIGGGVNVLSQFVGIKSYPAEDWKTNKAKLGLPIYTDPYLYSNENPVYDNKSYYSDTLAKLGSTKPSEVIGNKDYPKDTQLIVEVHELKKELDNIPKRRLIDLPTDPIGKDGKPQDTFVELYNQFLKRQEIVKSGDEAALKAFDSDPRTSSAKSGNMSQTEFVLLSQRNAITDPIKRKAFDKLHPELTANKYEDYMRSHPDENAKLAVLGQEDLYSYEAMSKAQEFLKTMDFPPNSVTLKNDKSLPPQAIAEDYFKYQDVPDGPGSDTAKSLMEAKNDALRFYLHPEWTPEKIKELKDSIPVLEMKVKNQPLEDTKASYSDQSSDAWLDDKIKDLNGKTARDRATDKLNTDNPMWGEDLERIKAIENDGSQFADKLVELHKKLRDGKLDENSAEAKAWWLDNKEIMDWAVSKKLKKQPEDWNERVIRLNVKWRKEDDAYNLLSTTGKVREDYLSKHTDYADDRRRRDLFSNRPDASLSLENAVLEYWHTPTGNESKRQERLVANNPELAQYLKGLNPKMEIKLPSEVPDVAYDGIYDQYETFFKAYYESEDKADFLKNMPKSQKIFYAREAYGKFVPKELVNDYADYNVLTRINAGKELPDGTLKNEYSERWFMEEHPEFRKEYLKTKNWNPKDDKFERLDFRGVPPRDVYARYLKMRDTVSRLTTSNKQIIYQNDRDLYDWLVESGKITPLKESDTRPKEIEDKLELINGKWVPKKKVPVPKDWIKTREFIMGR